MTAIDDAKTIVEILTGTIPGNARLVRIGDAFAESAGTAFKPATPNAPTNEEKAQNFLNMLRRDGRRVLRRYGQESQQATDLAGQQAAGDTAAGDL